ncbi:hypothetical protein [Pseudomonas lundensis]|uniref:hypothetical protein n=1 Tax=Pseudomonas lundensis TaxID=86185 RepID=UPI0020C82302|nr:hypothetical protein [Pseudomonas lundensis]
MEAGSVAVLASVQHPFSATQDLAKTKSVRGLGDGHSSFERYTGCGGGGFLPSSPRGTTIWTFRFPEGLEKRVVFTFLLHANCLSNHLKQEGCSRI